MYIYIEEHQNHAKTIKKYHLMMRGQDRIKAIFSFEYYNDSSNEEEIISHEIVLTQLFKRLNRFPIYLSFGFHELTDLEKEDLMSTVKRKQLPYTEILITKRERYMTVVPVIDMTKPTTFFKTGFDFENILIFSNETDFDALEKIEALFPEDEIER